MLETRLKKFVFFCCVVTAFALGITSAVRADGEETLGSPSIGISTGTGFVMAGTGLEPQPGSFDLVVPNGVRIQQVLLYWSGASSNGGVGDNTISINNTHVTGDHIGTGPGQKTYESFRADITILNLISTGNNTITIEGMEFNNENDGAGILVIYDDGSALAEIDLRDGLDIAYINRPEPGQTTIPQTFNFEPSSSPRTADLGFFVGSVLPNRPNVIRTTINGAATDHFNLLSSAQGNQWDSLMLSIDIPAGASELTVEIQSESDGTDRLPASLTWINVTLAVHPVPGAMCANFSTLPPGANVEGLGAVHPSLSIDSSGDLISILEGQSPTAYISGAARISNGALGDTGGLYDRLRQHDYTFTFAPDVEVGFFTVHAVDWGDFNPNRAKYHEARLVAYDTDGNILDTHVLSFDSNGAILPVSNEYGALSISGDAGTAQQGQPGNFIFNVIDLNKSIARVELTFASDLPHVASSDPAFGLKDICFGQPPSPPVCVNFADLPLGSSVEGLNAVAEHLNISTTNGRSVAIAEGALPYAYVANGGTVINGGLGAAGGLADLSRLHDYTFTFAPDVTAGYFTVHMLDYGDWNPNKAKLHQAQMTAYDSNGAIVSTEMLRFTSNGGAIPISDKFGNVGVSGDAITAMNGEPGSFIFTVSALSMDIARIELRFTNDTVPNMPTDPFLALKNICYSTHLP